ncbi:MAG TPA: T9SS type A sorting domain-containing protein [Ignavibacteriaceae bacterium]|nr:T9SS type A sorting domain-containing protein [Ignavibacteriaceae bacterium]
MKTFFTTLLFLLISSISIAQSKLDSGLVAFFPFNGNANDESGNGFNGIIHGATLVQDKYGNANSAFQFNGVSDDITVSHDPLLTLTQQITLTAWVKRTRFGIDMIFEKGGDWTLGTCNYGMSLHYINNNMFYFFFSGGWRGTSGVNDYDWHHYAIVAQQGQQNPLLYIDGELKPIEFSEGASVINLASSSLDLHIGSQLGTYPYYGANIIDDIRIYERLLTEQEIYILAGNKGLVAYFPFNGNANDESGNGNNGINHNGIFSKDRFGNDNSSMLFSGNDSYVEGTNPGNNLPTGNSPRTITAWIKEYSFHPWGNNIFHYGLDQAAPTNFHLYTTDVIRFGNGYDFGVVAGTTPIVDSTWHFVAGVYEGGSEHIAKVYVDGKLDGTGVLSTEPNTILGSNWKIGRFMTGSNNFNGEIDEVKIYNWALTETEIEKEYNLTRKSLVAYYPFNGNANDESGNGNHGTITGALVTPAADRYGEEGKVYKFWYPDYVSVPTNSSFFTDEFTVSYWYKVEAYWGDRCVLSCVGRNGGYQQPFSGTTFQYLFGYNFPTNSWFWTNYTVPNTPNTWQHIATTYKKTGDNASITKLYINGELKSSDTYGNTIAYPGSEIFYIGRNHSDLGLNGELDEVRFYNKTLDDQEIKNLYLSETKPVLQSPANQSTVATLTPEMIWRSPLENVEFRFQLSTDSLFSSILHEIVTTNIKTQLPDTLLAEGQIYYWRVRTTINGETGPWSEVYNFNILLTDVKNEHQLPTEFALMQNYPNPFNPSTTIKYNIPSLGKGLSAGGGLSVQLKVYDILGNEIATLVNEQQPAGVYEINFNSNKLASGVYLYKLQAGGFTETRKMILMR